MKKILFLFSFCFLGSAYAQVFKVTNEGLILVADSASNKKITDAIYTNFKGPLSSTIEYSKSWMADNAGKYFAPAIEYDSLIVLKTGSGWGCISKRGKTVLDFKFIKPLCFFNNAKYYGYFGTASNEYYEYASDFYISDWGGNVIAHYGWMLDHSGDAYLMSGISSKKCGYETMEKYKYGIVSSDLDTLLPFAYKCTSWDDKNFGFSEKGFIALKNKEGKCGVVNNKGETLIPFEYDYIDDVVFDINEIIKDSLCGLLDANLKWIVPIEYEKIESNYTIYGPVAAYLYKGGKWSLLDSNYQIQDEKFDGYNIYYDDKANIIVNVNGKYGVYNARSKTYSISLKYDSIIRYNIEEDTYISPTDNHILAIQGNHYCFYNSQFQKIYETGAAKIELAKCSDYMVIEKDQKKYLMKNDGKLIAGPYDDMQCAMPITSNSSVFYPYFLVKKDTKYGWIGTDGNIVVPIEYDDFCKVRLEYDSGGNHGFTFILLKKSTIYYYDKNGKSLGTKQCDNIDNFCKQ